MLHKQFSNTIAGFKLNHDAECMIMVLTEGLTKLSLIKTYFFIIINFFLGGEGLKCKLIYFLDCVYNMKKQKIKPVEIN